MPTFTFNNQSEGTSYVVLDPLFGINPVPSSTSKYFSGVTFTSFSNISRDDIVVNDYKLGIVIPQGNSSFEFTPSTSIPIPDVIIRGAGDCSVTYVDGATTINITPEELNQSVIPGATPPTPPAGYNNQYSFEFRGNQYVNEPYFSTPDNSVFDLTDEFTISAWVRPHEVDPPADEVIIKKSTGNPGQSAGNGWALYHDNNSTGFMSFDLKNGGTRFRLQASNIPAGDVWYHVTVTYESSTAKMYINSVEEESLVTSFPSLGTNTNSVFVGTSTAAGSFFYSGSLQNVSIFSVAFDQTEVDELYNGGTPDDLNDHSQVANGIAWWQLGGNGESGSFAANWTELNCFNNAQYVMTSANVLETDRIEETP